MLNNLHTNHNRGVRVAPLRKQDIQKYARKLREYFQPDIHQPFDVLHCIEIGLAKAMKHEFNFDLKDSAYMGITEAAVSPDKKYMQIRYDVYYALFDGDTRARFTIAHEIGHLFMHKGTALNRGDGGHKTYEDSEWQANQFAAELLAPLVGCVGLDVAGIMSKYKISYQCASLRYAEANKK